MEFSYINICIYILSSNMKIKRKEGQAYIYQYSSVKQEKIKSVPEKRIPYSNL